MKHLMLIFLSFLMLTTAGARTTNNSIERELNNVINAFERSEGFESVRLGGLMMKLLKAAAKSEMDPDDKEEAEAIRLFTSLKSMTVVDYEDMSYSKKQDFSNRIKSICSKLEKLIEAKEDGETVFIYGNISKDGSIISDILISVPEDGALIYCSGNISIDNIAKLKSLAD